MEKKLDFTKRELDVITLLAQGYTNKQIAENLFISIHTVKSHLETISYKFGVSGRLLIALNAIRAGIIE